MKYCIFDIETDGFDPTKVHCVSYWIQGWHKDRIDTITSDEDIKNLFSSDYVFVGHNIIEYDLWCIEKLYGIEIDYKNCVDTLALSYYLYYNKPTHNLEDWGETFGIKKVEIEDWEGLSAEEYKRRCEIDVKITKSLFGQQMRFLQKLYNNKHYRNLIKYLSFKMYCLKLAKKSKWKLDVEGAKKLLAYVNEEMEKREAALKEVMPRPTEFTNRPKVMYKKNGELSKRGEAWVELCEQHGLDGTKHDKVLVDKGEEPNPNSHVQIKEWLYDLGWEPCTFKKNSKGEKVPQVKDPFTRDLTDSILRLKEKHPEVENLDKLSVLQSRKAVLEGFLRDEENGTLQAKAAGFTNTFRLKHRELVNIPNTSSYLGKEIRSLLTSREGKMLCGADVSSLEDSTKQHLIYNYDPEYVKEMQQEGFDPHLDIAVRSGLLTTQQAEAHKKGEADYSDQRADAKRVNFASVYGVQEDTLALSLGTTKKKAAELLKGYWERNKAVKMVERDAIVKKVNGVNWIFNPVNGFWYFLKNKKDKFSVLNQGLGCYCFDVWLLQLLKLRPQLTGQFHDEFIAELKQGFEGEMTGLVKQAMYNANNILKLNVRLKFDIKFGQNYAEVH